MISVQAINTTAPKNFLFDSVPSSNYEIFNESWELVLSKRPAEQFYINLHIFQFQIKTMGGGDCLFAFGFPSDFRQNQKNYFSDEVIANLIGYFSNFLSSSSCHCCSSCKDVFLMLYSYEVISHIFTEEFLQSFKATHLLIHPGAILELPPALPPTSVFDTTPPPSSPVIEEEEVAPVVVPPRRKRKKRTPEIPANRDLSTFEKPLQPFKFNFFS